MRVTNLLFWAQDNEASARFYKKLGFTVERSDDNHSVVKLNGFEIVLVTMRDEDMFSKDALSSDKGRGVYVYIRVDDVDKTHAEFLKLGLKSMTTPKDWEWGNREFVLKDPDGYKLCFWQPVS